MIRIARTVFAITISIGLMVWVLSGSRLSEFLVVAATTDPRLLLLALSLHGIGLLLSAMRWATLLKIQSIDFSFRATVLLYWIGCFFNSFLPTSVGGDVVRSYLASKHNGKIMDTAISVIAERVAGVAALMILFSMGVIWLQFFSAEESLWKFAGFSSAGFIGVGCVSSARKALWDTALVRTELREKFNRIGAVLLTYKLHKRKLWRILILSVLLQINVIVYYYIIAAALGIQLSVFYFCLFIPPIIILTMLPISVGGVGVREAAFLFFFVPLGITPAEIVSLSLWSYILALLANLSGGLVYCFYQPASR
jgi:glycosyltransferase 2 family protein